MVLAKESVSNSEASLDVVYLQFLFYYVSVIKLSIIIACTTRFAFTIQSAMQYIIAEQLGFTAHVARHALR